MTKEEKSTSDKILITRFPLESAWGGEEEIHLLMAELFRRQDRETFLLSSSAPLLSAFRQEGFRSFREFQKDLTSKPQLAWSILTLPFFFLRGIFWLPYFRFVRGVRTVLFLTFIEKIAWTPLALLFGMKVFWGHHAPLGKWFFQNPYLFLWKRWSKKDVRIIVPSEFLKNQLSPLLPGPERIVVIPNTSNKIFVQYGDRLPRLLQKLFYEKTGRPLDLSPYFLVGTANRLAPEKGMDDVLATARLLKNEPSPLLFLCAGEGPERATLEKRVAEAELENEVFFLGFLTAEELSVFFAGIDLFLLASHEEPFGIAVLEAMAQKKAVIATRVGGIPEVLGQKNEGLVSPGNPAEIAAKIRFFRDRHAEREELAEKNRQRFLQKFSAAEFEQKVMNTFFDH